MNNFLEFMKTPQWKLLSAGFNVALLIVFSVWLFYILEIKETILDFNFDQVEECFYLVCEQDFTGTYSCREAEFMSSREEVIKGIFVGENISYPNTTIVNQSPGGT